EGVALGERLTVEHPHLPDVRVVEAADREREDVGRGDDAPVLPALVAAPAVETVADLVGVVQLGSGPADGCFIKPSALVDKRHRRDDLAVVHIRARHRTLRIGMTDSAPANAKMIPAMKTAV